MLVESFVYCVIFFLLVISDTLILFKNLKSMDFFLIYFIYFYFCLLWGLRCCTRAFSSCGEQGLLFIAVRGLLITVASLVAEHRI